MAQYFVLLEILDPTVRDFLSALRDVFSKRTSKTAIHVTLRGPYRSPLDEHAISEIASKIQGDPLLIHGAGMFHNDQTHFTYLRVSSSKESTNLSRVTRKFDFPKTKFRFNPHITIYSGPDEALATEVLNFLRRERIELLAHNLRILIHPSFNQLELLPLPSIDLFERRNLKPTGLPLHMIETIERARKIVDNWV